MALAIVTWEFNVSTDLDPIQYSTDYNNYSQLGYGELIEVSSVFKLKRNDVSEEETFIYDESTNPPTVISDINPSAYRVTILPATLTESFNAFYPFRLINQEFERIYQYYFTDLSGAMPQPSSIDSGLTIPESWLIHPGRMSGDLWHMIAALHFNPNLKLYVLEETSNDKNKKTSQAFVKLINDLGFDKGRRIVAHTNQNTDNAVARNEGAGSLFKQNYSSLPCGLTWASTSVIAAQARLKAAQLYRTYENEKTAAGVPIPDPPPAALTTAETNFKNSKYGTEAVVMGANAVNATATVTGADAITGLWDLFFSCSGRRRTANFQVYSN